MKSDNLVIKKKYYYVFNEGSKINQVLCAILSILNCHVRNCHAQQQLLNLENGINIPLFAYGASIGWMSPMTLVLQSDQSPRGEPLSDSEISWMASIAYLLCVPSNYLMAFMGDRCGRKITIIFISSMCVACWIIKLSSVAPWAFLLARAFVGMSMGCYVACPLYSKEVSEDSMRGILSSLVILFHVCGNLFIYVIGDLLSYQNILWVCLLLPTLHLVLFMMMPESPSYLVKQGRDDEALRVLAWLRCRSESDGLVHRELEVLKKEQKNDEGSSSFVLKAILSDKILRRAFQISIIVCLAREVCGITPVLNFAGDIFSMSSKGSGLFLTPNQQAMVLGAVQVTGSMLASSVVEKAGRKPILFITSLISGISMCALATWFLTREHGVVLPSWLPVVALCLCVFCDSAGLCPIGVVITGEIFSFKYRSTVFATGMTVATLSNFIQVLFFKPISNTIGVHFAFYFFGLVCLANAVYTLLVVPETKMKSLEEIYNLLKTKKERVEELKQKELQA